MSALLYEKIYTDLRDQIRRGQLKSGDRVPSEKELAEQYHVSRITSKKALEMLTQDGSVERIQGKGTYVAAFPAAADLEKADIARASTSFHTPLIGLILSDFDESYGQGILKAVEARCSENGYSLVLKLSYDSREEEEQAIKTFLEAGAEGLIILPVHGEYYNADLLRLAVDRFPLVMVDRPLRGISTCAVHTDNKKAAAQITHYLVERGRENIAFLSPPPENTTTIEERIAGFAEVLSQCGRAFYLTDLHSTLPNCFVPENIAIDKQAIQLFLVQNPNIQAFVACEYNIALMLASVIQEMGKQIPDDYGIVCFDSPPVHMGEPQFTHIEQDETTMGQKAVDMLIAQIRGEAILDPQAAIEYRLVKGRSTK